jgi:hypothetical protein
LHDQIKTLKNSEEPVNYKVHAAADAGKAIAALLKVKLDHLRLVDDRDKGRRE